jgi:hypothetical protein
MEGFCFSADYSLLRWPLRVRGVLQVTDQNPNFLGGVVLGFTVQNDGAGLVAELATITITPLTLSEPEGHWIECRETGH